MQPESSSQNGEKNRSFGVLTMTNSTSIDSYFATKLAKLRSKADKDKFSAKAALQMANDSCSSSDIMADKQRKQTMPQLSSPTSSKADCAQDFHMLTAKQHKKKRQKTKLEGSDCHTDNKHLCSKSLECNGKSKKKRKKRHDNDSLEAAAASSDDDQNEKTAEATKKRKKRASSLTVANELNRSPLTKTLSKKQKKSRHCDSQTR